MSETTRSQETRYARLINRLKVETVGIYTAIPTLIGGVIVQELGVEVPKPIIAVAALAGISSLIGFVNDNQSLRFHNPLEGQSTPTGDV